MLDQGSSLSELIAWCVRSDDTAAHDRLIARLQPLVAGVAARSAMRWGPVTADLVEDLSQEAFLKICRNRFRILANMQRQADEAIFAFVKATVANLVHDHFRAIHAGKRIPPGALIDAEAVPVGDSRSASAAEQRILLAEVDRILEQQAAGPTAARDRRIFWLHHRQGFTARAIAGIPVIGLSEKGVESVLFRLNAIVKEHMAREKGISAKGASS